jgi:hypothetical protein
MTAIATPNSVELKELGDKIEAKRKDVFEIIAEAKGTDGNVDLGRIKKITGTSEQKAAELQRRQQELAVLGVEYDAKFWQARAAQLEEQAAKFASMPGFPGGGAGNTPSSGKSLGELFVESVAFKERGKNRAGPTSEVGADVEVKTVLQTSAGWAPQAIRTGMWIENAQRPIQVLDLIPQGETDQAAVVFMEETTFTNNAAEVAEAAAYAEAALAYTERTSNVRKVGVSLPVTDEQLQDVPQIRGIINNRVVFMLRQRLDSQVLVGNGVAPNLMGLLNVAGVQTTAKAAGEPVFDADYRAQRLVKITGRAIPNGYVFHPTNWESQRLTRTTEGIYLLGNPGDAAPARLWGQPVTEGDAITLNTGLIGAFATMCELVFRRGIEVQVGYVNDDFLKGKSTLRADLRVAFPTYRAAGFCTITGLP